MPNLPVDDHEPLAAVVATMLYPDAARRAQAWKKGYLAEAIKHYLANGGVVPPDWIDRYFFEPRTDLHDIKKRWKNGLGTGNVLKYLRAIFNHDPALASWNNAEKLVRHAIQQRGESISLSSLRSWRPRYMPVAHLWATWSLWDGLYGVNETVGSNAYSHLCFFVSEAEQLRIWGQNTAPIHGSSEAHLPANMWKAPEGWEPPKFPPEWPRNKEFSELLISAEEAALLKPAGRPSEEEK